MPPKYSMVTLCLVKLINPFCQKGRGIKDNLDVIIIFKFMSILFISISSVLGIG